jgi:hypothetical protein
MGIDDIILCVDYRILNLAYVHDPFPTPFSDEVLDQVASKEAYSFTYGFSCYHEVRIAKDDKRKMTFTIKWVFFSYNVMPFGIKNALVVFSQIVIATFHDFIHKFLKVYMDDWTL